MEVGQNIAKNAALRENVFMMAICVELRIPLFLVGKPGSSKSLAKAIIYNSMKGRRESRKELLKNFKEVKEDTYCICFNLCEVMHFVVLRLDSFHINVVSFQLHNLLLKFSRPLSDFKLSKIRIHMLQL